MRLHCAEWGDPKGLPVVLVHGFPMSSALWEPQRDALKEFRVIAPDLRGFGGTRLVAPWFIENAVDDVLETLGEKKVEKAVFCGLSMGGYVVLRLAEKAPERVRALALCDTRAEPDGNEAKLKRAAAVDFVRTRGTAAFLEPFLKDSVAAGNPKALEFLKKAAAAAPADAVMAALAALAARGDAGPGLGRIGVPTLVLVGAEDKLTPPALSKAMAQAIRGAELREIAGAGHFSNAENADAFNAALVDFLRRLPR